MLINLSDVLSRDEKEFSTVTDVEMSSFSSGAGRFPITETMPLSLHIHNVGDKVLEITGKTTIAARIPCSRCLEDVETKLELDIFRKIDMKLSEEERLEKLDEDSYITDCSLDTEGLIYDELLTDWPVKVLCREDCKGICSKCGKNLNDGPCNCEQDSTDLRMAAILDIFHNSQT